MRKRLKKKLWKRFDSKLAEVRALEAQAIREFYLWAEQNPQVSELLRIEMSGFALREALEKAKPMYTPWGVTESPPTVVERLKWLVETARQRDRRKQVR